MGTDVDLAELIIRESVRDRYAAYNRSGDKGRLAELADCFTPDGVLEAAGYFTARGRREIIDALSGPPGGQGRLGDSPFADEGTPAPKVRHFVSSLRFDEVSTDVVRSSAYFLVCVGERVDHWGTYRDVLTRRDGRWLFSHRVVVVDAEPGKAT